MTDKEIITHYRDIVFNIYYLKEQIAWNKKHNLSFAKQAKEFVEAVKALQRFEELIDSIKDRRTRNIICLRYALGESERDTAYRMRVSRGTVSRICAEVLKSLEDSPLSVQ